MGLTDKLKLFILVVLLFSCTPETSYDEIVKEELARGVRFDSVAHGINLGMTFNDFKRICFLQNREGVFKPNSGGHAVQLTITDGFRYPVYFEFFPADIIGQYDTIVKYDASIKYKNYSNFNEEMNIERLVKETIAFFEEGYQGRSFIGIPNTKDPWVKSDFVKVDGNRKITLLPVYMGIELIIEFEDLSGSGR